MAHRRRRSLESERRVRGGGMPAGDWAKPGAPAGGGDPAHRIPSEDGAGVGPAPGVVTGPVGGRPVGAVVTTGCVAWGAADAVTGWSATPPVDGLSVRLRRGSGPTPASRDRRAASAMAANAPGLTLWSVCFPGLRVCTIFLRKGTCQSGVVPRRTPQQLHYLSRPSPVGIAPTSPHPLTYPPTGVLNVRAVLGSGSGRADPAPPSLPLPSPVSAVALGLVALAVGCSARLGVRSSRPSGRRPPLARVGSSPGTPTSHVVGGALRGALLSAWPGLAPRSASLARPRRGPVRWPRPARPPLASPGPSSFCSTSRWPA